MDKGMAGNGIGLGGAVFLVFLYLKLTDQIEWSWWWVTAPLWGGLAIFVLLAGLAVGVVMLTLWLKDRRRKRGALR